MSKGETKNEEERMRVVLLLLVLSWLQPNDEGNTQKTKETIVAIFVKKAKALVGDGLLELAKHLGVQTVDGKSILCYSNTQTNPPPSDGALWRLIGLFFKDLGAPVGNLSPPKKGKKASGWTVANRNAMAVKVLVYFGIGKGANSKAFEWVTDTKADGVTKVMKVKTMIQTFIEKTSSTPIPLMEDLIDADDEADDADEWEFADEVDEDDDDIIQEDNLAVVEVADAEIEGATGKEQLNNLRNHYNKALVDTKILHGKKNLKSDAPAFMYGLFYTLMQLANGNGGTGYVLNLFFKKNVNSKVNTLLFNEKALEAIKQGIGTSYSIHNESKNITTTKVVADLRVGVTSTLLGRVSRMVMTSLHLNVNKVYDFCSDLDINADNFIAYGMRLIINTIENGGDADKLGYGFIQEINRVGNTPMYEAMMAFYGINLDGEDRHSRLFAVMTKTTSSEKAGKWDNWEEDIIQ